MAPQAAAFDRPSSAMLQHSPERSARVSVECCPTKRLPYYRRSVEQKRKWAVDVPANERQYIYWTSTAAPAPICYTYRGGGKLIDVIDTAVNPYWISVAILL